MLLFFPFSAKKQYITTKQELFKQKAVFNSLSKRLVRRHIIMVYDGWSLEMDLLANDEWYRWEDFVHFVRYRLGQLSFTYDRRSIRLQLDLPRSLKQYYQPFRIDCRFPENQILINTSFEVDICIRRILSSTDIPDFNNFDSCSPEAFQIYNKAKELYYVHLNELYAITNYTDNLLAEKGVFNRKTFEDRNSLKWIEATIPKVANSK